MPKKSMLQFNGYTVNEILFKATPQCENVKEFSIQTNFQQQVIECADETYDVTLSVDIASTDEHPMPFDLRVSITGHFSYQESAEDIPVGSKETILSTNTAAILFPFLRAIVASVTTNANVPPLLLPIMNFAAGK